MVDEPLFVETDLFEHREVKPHFINACCFGEDFAAWLKNELQGRLDSSFRLSAIIQEDWGWEFCARHGRDPFWICIGYVEEVRESGAARWGIFLKCDYGLNIFRRVFNRPDPIALSTLQHRIRSIIGANTKIRIVAE